MTSTTGPNDRPRDAVDRAVDQLIETRRALNAALATLRIRHSGKNRHPTPDLADLDVLDRVLDQTKADVRAVRSAVQNTKRVQPPVGLGRLGLRRGEKMAREHEIALQKLVVAFLETQPQPLAIMPLGKALDVPQQALRRALSALIYAGTVCVAQPATYATRYMVTPKGVESGRPVFRAAVVAFLAKQREPVNTRAIVAGSGVEYNFATRVLHELVEDRVVKREGAPPWWTLARSRTRSRTKRRA